MIQPEDFAPTMSPFQDKTDTIDLSDLERDAGALISEIARAGETIIAESASPAAASSKPATKKHHDDHADPSAMTDAAIDAAPEDQPEIPREYAPEPGADEDAAPITDAAAVAESVDELIADALSAVDAIGEQASDADATPSETDAAAVAELAAEVERLTAEAASLIESVESDDAAEPVDSDESMVAEAVEATEATEATEVAEERAAATLAAPASPDRSDTADIAAAEPALDQSSAARESTEPNDPIEPVAGGGVMASLDAAIESEAEALEDDLDTLEGDFETPDEVARGADHSLEEDTEYFDDEPIDPATVVIESRHDEEEDESPSAREKPPAAPAVARDTSAPDAGSTAAPSAAPSSALTGWKAAIARLTSAVTRDAIERRVLRPLAAPLLRLPPNTRDTIGWVGVNTVFVAVCLWLYLTLR